MIFLLDLIISTTEIGVSSTLKERLRKRERIAIFIAWIVFWIGFGLLLFFR